VNQSPCCGIFHLANCCTYVPPQLMPSFTYSLFQVITVWSLRHGYLLQLLLSVLDSHRICSKYIETHLILHLTHGYNYTGSLRPRQTNKINKQMLEVQCCVSCEGRSILGTASRPLCWCFQKKQTYMRKYKIVGNFILPCCIVKIQVTSI
jgi:hypothetical protein